MSLCCRCNEVQTIVPGPQGLAGATGNTGGTGSSGPTGPAGSGIDWQGAWNPATTYAVNSGVTYNGSTWIALQPSTNIAPTTNSVFWSLVAIIGNIGNAGASAFQTVTETHAPGQNHPFPSNSTDSTGVAVALGSAGTYLISARCRITNDTSSYVTVTLSLFLYDSGHAWTVPNSYKSFNPVNLDPSSGTAAIATILVTYPVGEATTVYLHVASNATSSYIATDIDLAAVQMPL